MNADRPPPRYAITGMGLGNAEDFRNIIAPFGGELLAELEALGCVTEISSSHEDGSAFALVPEHGPAVASAGHDLVVGFLLVVSGSIGGGVAQAVGADIYQNALKKPVASLAHRLRDRSASTRQVILLAETWLAEENVLVQTLVHWRPDDLQEDLADVLTDALESAEMFWRQPNRPETRALGGSCVVRIEIATDGSVTRPRFVDPRHRMPGAPSFRTPTTAPADSDDLADGRNWSQDERAGFEERQEDSQG